VRAWGDNSHQQTNVPSALTNVMSIATGPHHAFAARVNGSVTNWGSWWPALTEYPASTVTVAATNIVQVAAGKDHGIALKSNGTVVVWGYTNTAYNAVPGGLSGVKSVAATWNHS